LAYRVVDLVQFYVKWTDTRKVDGNFRRGTFRVAGSVVGHGVS